MKVFKFASQLIKSNTNIIHLDRNDYNHTDCLTNIYVLLRINFFPKNYKKYRAEDFRFYIKRYKSFWLYLNDLNIYSPIKSNNCLKISRVIKTAYEYFFFDQWISSILSNSSGIQNIIPILNFTDLYKYIFIYLPALFIEIFNNDDNYIIYNKRNDNDYVIYNVKDIDVKKFDEITQPIFYVMEQMVDATSNKLAENFHWIERVTHHLLPRLTNNKHGRVFLSLTNSLLSKYL